MKPLSLFKFLKGSFGKVIPLALTAMLAVGLLYFGTIVVQHLSEDKYEMNVSWLENMSVITDNDPTMSMRKGTGISAADEAMLRGCADVKELFAANLWSVDYRTITDKASLFIVMLDGQNVAPAMQAEGLRLAEGTMPSNPGEVVLQRKLAANLGLKVGSVVTKDETGWQIGTDLKVVGVADGPALIGFGEIHPCCVQIGTSGVGLVAFSGGTGVGRMNQFIESSLGRKYNIFTLAMAMPEVNKVAQVFNLVMIFIGVIIVIALGVLLGNITMMQYSQRVKEFELINAIGYTKKFIAGKILKELGLSNILGYVVGIGLGLLAGWFMNVYLLEDTFQQMHLLNFGGMLLLLLVPLFITAFGMIAPLKMLRFKEII